jgi:hypothetical protein
MFWVVLDNEMKVLNNDSIKSDVLKGRSMILELNPSLFLTIMKKVSINSKNENPISFNLSADCPD